MNNEEEKTFMGIRLEGPLEGGNLVPKDSLADSSQVSHIYQSRRADYSYKFRGDMDDQQKHGDNVQSQVNKLKQNEQNAQSV